MPQVRLYQEGRFELPGREQQDWEVMAGSLQIEGVGEEGFSRISFEVKKWKMSSNGDIFLFIF